MPSHPARPDTPLDAVLIGPDGSTAYRLCDVAAALSRTIDELPPGGVVRVRVSDLQTRADLAEWCLIAGRRIVNPFAHFLDDELCVAA